MERVGVDAPAPLERPRGREWAAWRDIVVHVHRHVHRYLATCLHNRKQHVLWCRSRSSAQRAVRGGPPSGYARSTLGREAHADACPRQHVDQGIDAEAMETPPHEIVHAGLAYPQEL